MEQLIIILFIALGVLALLLFIAYKMDKHKKVNDDIYKDELNDREKQIPKRYE
jgi:uncharacterized membrane protein YsdA (DUF1294 family)